MELELQAEAPPLRREDTGALRVGNSRVLLELVIRAFEDGATPESIVQQYSTCTLAEIYGVIGYYLRHPDEVDAYLASRDRQAEELRKRIEHRLGAHWRQDMEQTIAWLLIPVLQECYHVILSRCLRDVWGGQDPKNRRPNWLAAYKHQPNLLAAGFADMTKFDEIVSAIPLTLARPDDLAASSSWYSLEERLRRYITTYHLLPQEALILAEAERLGVTAVATLDHDWRRVAEFDVYTTPA